MDNHNISGNFPQEEFINKRNNIIANLRPGQDLLAEWQNGAMAVSAVPGAGKSHSLAITATLTIAKNQLNKCRINNAEDRMKKACFPVLIEIYNSRFIDASHH